MPSYIDLSGKRIGRVLVISDAGVKGTIRQWNCKCDCGKLFVCYPASFKRGQKFECKECLFERRRGPDLTGRKYGRWTVLRREVDSNNKTVYYCRCDCGKEGLVASYSLGKRSKSMSCGCWGRKIKSKFANPSLYPKASGLSRSDFYKIRTSLIHKCYNETHPSYKRFGAKGITVCDLWRNSAKDMFEWLDGQGWKKKDVILLKEGKEEFGPESVYFISQNEFNSDLSSSGGIQVTYQGETHSVKRWASIMGISPSALRKNLHSLPSVDEAFQANYRHIWFAKSPDLIAQAVDMYKSGKSYASVAKEFGITSSALRYHLVKNDIELRASSDKYLHITNDTISELVGKGLSVSQIARKLNVTWACISYRIKKINGIKRDRSAEIMRSKIAAPSSSAAPKTDVQECSD